MALNFGLIGGGNISATYAYVLQRNPDSTITAIADIDLIKARKIADAFGIKNIYADYHQMLIQERLDALVICTPHYVHHEQALAGADHGLPILCEKPLATTMEDITDMIQHCSSVPLGTMLQRRCYPNTIAAAAAVHHQALGKIEEVTLQFSCHKSFDFYSSWRGKKISGGGVLMSQALHRIDQLVYILGTPSSVSGTTRITRSYLEVEDYAHGKVFFGSEVVADIEADNSSGDEETRSIISITGSAGRIMLSDDKTLEWKVPGFPVPDELDINAVPIRYRPAYYGPAHEKVIDDFVDAVKNHRRPAITGADSLPAMKIIFGFYESAATGRTVLLSP